MQTEKWDTMKDAVTTRVAVAGGAGYIGTQLVGLLLARGHRVMVIDRFFFGRDCLDSTKDHPNLEIVRQDSRWISPDMLGGVDAVVDLTGLANDPSCEIDREITLDINRHGSLRLAEIAGRIGARFLFSSSCSVYGHGEHSDLVETSACRPVSLYARTKLEVEQTLLQHWSNGDLKPIIFRNATVFGVSKPRTRFDLLVNMMTAYAVERGKIFILGGGRQWRPLVHVRDVARAFLAAIESPDEGIIGEIFNVSHRNYRVRDVAKLVAEEIPGIEIETIPDDPDLRNYSICAEKIRGVLGFEAKITVREGIREIQQEIRDGTIDSQQLRARTLDYYKFLLEAERVVREIAIDGRIL